MDIVIMAGGKGTRIASVASEIPKPMIPIEGKPVLERIIENITAQGFKNITLVTGHLGNIIKEHFGDGSSFGCNISYFHETEPLGTAGALYYIKDRLGDDFFLLNADAVMDIDLKRMADFYYARGGSAAVLVHPNDHPYDSSLVAADKNGLITNWYKKGEYAQGCKNRVNAGVHLLNKAAAAEYVNGQKTDLDSQVLMPLVEKRMVYAYESTEYIKDMGTPERYEAVSRDIRSGKPAARNLSNKQKAVFLDRDGTLNVYKGFITRPDMIELIPGTAEAVKRLNKSSYLSIVVTNQPVIARGDCTFEELEAINGRLETLLGKERAYLDDIFYCPHHPDKGFEGERPELKFVCECRKPKPGLLSEAAKKYNIDLEHSYMVGDSLSDLAAGAAAGCTPVYIGSEPLADNKYGALQYGSLLEFTESLDL